MVTTLVALRASACFPVWSQRVYATCGLSLLLDLIPQCSNDFFSFPGFSHFLPPQTPTFVNSNLNSAQRATQWIMPLLITIYLFFSFSFTLVLFSTKLNLSVSFYPSVSLWSPSDFKHLKKTPPTDFQQIHFLHSKEPWKFYNKTICHVLYQ